MRTFDIDELVEEVSSRLGYKELEKTVKELVAKNDELEKKIAEMSNTGKALSPIHDFGVCGFSSSVVTDVSNIGISFQAIIIKNWETIVWRRGSYKIILHITNNSDLMLDDGVLLGSGGVTTFHVLDIPFEKNVHFFRLVDTKSLSNNEWKYDVDGATLSIGGKSSPIPFENVRYTFMVSHENSFKDIEAFQKEIS